MKRLLLKAVWGALITFGVPSVAAGQTTFETYSAADWRDIVPSKRTEYQTYRTIVLTNPSLSDDEKAKRVSDKFVSVQNEVRTARVEAYKAVQRKIGVATA